MIKQQKKKKQTLGGEWKSYLRKNYLFTRNFDRSIAKFFLFYLA